MTRCLVIGDLHFQDNGEVDFFNLFISKIDDLLATGKYDHVVLLGDVCHKFKHTDRATQTLVCSLFSTITKTAQLYVLVGNHDMDDSQQFLTENHILGPYKKWPKVTIVDRPIRKKIGRIVAVLCPYVPKGRLVEALDTVEWKDANVILCHQEMLGCKMGATESIDGDHWNKKWPALISGHIHDRQQIGNVYYTGTPYDLGWQENEKRYVLSLGLKEEALSLKYMTLDMPKKIIVKLDFDASLKWQVPEETGDKSTKGLSMDSGNHYKLKICCTKEQFKQFSSQRKDLKKVPHLKIIHVSADVKAIEKFLQEKRKIGGNGDYKSILTNLVAKENVSVQELYRKIVVTTI